MPYKFATESRDYSDYASGRVFYSAPGHPAFPVRLISEVFQRCQAIRQSHGETVPAVIYDPCCGGAYHLSALAYLHWQEIDSIIASDIDGEILQAAERNLRLLSPIGLSQRKGEIEAMLKAFGKSSHTDALESVRSFEDQLQLNTAQRKIETSIFQADATNHVELKTGLGGRAIDIVLADVPYGGKTSWKSADGQSMPAGESLLDPMLDGLLPVVSGRAIVAVMADKGQKCRHPSYERLERFQIGKRRIYLLRPKN